MEEQRIPAALQKAMAIGYEQIPHGEVASYIPELAKARKDALGICFTAPSARQNVSSISEATK